MKIVFVLPISLFEDNELIDMNTTVYLIEHSVYFTLYPYHKLKLILHRATMRNYLDFIKEKYGCKVKYINYDDSLEKIIRNIDEDNIHMHDPIDHLVIKDIKQICDTEGIKLYIHDSPHCLSSSDIINEYYNGTDTYYHSSFYKFHRKRLNILMTKNNQPVGGKWTYDVENRLPFPKQFTKNYKPKAKDNKYIREAIKYIQKHFPDNIGSTDMYLPIDHQGAKHHLRIFVVQRLKCFGSYQDAVDKNIPFGCHSLLSPLLNIGLLTPRHVVRYTLQYGIDNKIPLNSLEGFLRQIIGWRSSMIGIYLNKRREMGKSNYFNNKRKLNKAIWFEGNGTTGFNIIDDMINKVIQYGYLHHIERLMYIGNFMLLNRIHPKDCFNWFMVMFIDSYNWVMYGNVYAMSQYSTGSLLMKRPYFSSSAYIDRMSSYKKGKSNIIKLGNVSYNWNDVWDALYYSFINDHKEKFKKNYAIARQVAHLLKKSAKEKAEVTKLAKLYFSQY